VSGCARFCAASKPWSAPTGTIVNLTRKSRRTSRKPRTTMGGGDCRRQRRGSLRSATSAALPIPKKSTATCAPSSGSKKAGTTCATACDCYSARPASRPSLALGIGANTALFSVTDAMMFRMLPDPARRESHPPAHVPVVPRLPHDSRPQQHAHRDVCVQRLPGERSNRQGCRARRHVRSPCAGPADRMRQRRHPAARACCRTTAGSRRPAVARRRTLALDSAVIDRESGPGGGRGRRWARARRREPTRLDRMDRVQQLWLLRAAGGDRRSDAPLHAGGFGSGGTHVRSGSGPSRNENGCRRYSESDRAQPGCGTAMGERQGARGVAGGAVAISSIRCSDSLRARYSA